MKKNSPTYTDHRQPISLRVKDLVSRLTLSEKVGCILHESEAVPRLGIPEYNFWSEGAHGVARAGKATVFPQTIGLAATFDVALVKRVAVAISDEARAKHHAAVKRGYRGLYSGLTLWCPNVNIFRDPRWGRGQETFGEDPYLTSRLGVAFIRGLQGNHPRYLKTIATPKHFAVHSGPESQRHTLNATPDLIDLWQTYLPAFKACIQEGGAHSIMAAYNLIGGTPCCANPVLLQQILRKEWGFSGFVVTDCGAIYSLHARQGAASSVAEASALAIKRGSDVHCGGSREGISEALATNLLTEAELDVAVTRALTARFRLGCFDPPAQVPYTKIPTSVVACKKHMKLSLEAARKSIVLLKNENGLLPLSKQVQKIHIVGPTAASIEALLGNYHGLNERLITILEGIVAKVDAAQRVIYEPGALLTDGPLGAQKLHGSVDAGKISDVVIAVVGNTPLLEGEEGDAIGSPLDGDRDDIGLPSSQEAFLRALTSRGGRIVVVLTGGGAISLPNDILEKVEALVQVWYPGQAGGTAVADVLFGDYNPGGRLPVTVYESVAQLPAYDDYRMRGRTYRYFEGEPQFSFGFGLSYTQFRYRKLRISPRSPAPTDNVTVSVDVENIGDRTGDEVAQLYLRLEEASAPVPLRQLTAFSRISLRPGERQCIKFVIEPQQRSVVNVKGSRWVEPGEISVWVGGCQPGSEERAKGSTSIRGGSFSARGSVTEIPR